MSFIYSALADKPYGLWQLGGSSPFVDSSAKAGNATATGTVNNGASLVKGAGSSCLFKSSTIASFPTTVFQKGNESKSFSLEAWVRPVAKSTSISEQQVLGNTGQYDGLIVNGTNVSFVTKYAATGECRAQYDTESLEAMHLVGVHTSNKNLLYINGQLVADASVSDVQQADSFIASDGKLYSGQTISSEEIMVNGVGVYTYALPAQSVLNHFIEGRNVPSGAEVPTFYGADRLLPVIDRADIFLDHTFDTAADWNTGLMQNVVAINDQLTPQFSNGISLPGVWTNTIPLSVSSNSTMYGVMVDWDGFGATVDVSLDGTTWETMTRGGKPSTISEGTTTAGKILFIRVTFNGNAADDDSYIDNLRVVAFNTGVITTNTQRTLTLVKGIPQHDHEVLEYNDNWGAMLNAGGSLTISADPSAEALPIRTLEVWIKQTNTTAPAISAAGTTYYNGSPTGTLRAGEWALMHVVFNANVTDTLTISGQCQIGQLAVYPTALSATNIADVYASYTGSGSSVIAVGDASAIVVQEPTDASNIYAYDWSINAAG